MKVISFFESDKKEYWLAEIGKCSWGAGKFLFELIRDGKLQEMLGKTTRVLLLTEGEELVSFCTFAEKDEIRSTELTPWIGFVYTFPERRGQRCVGKLFEEIERIALSENIPQAYLSTDHVGLYEKYGCDFYGMMEAVGGEQSRIYIKHFCKKQ